MKSAGKARNNGLYRHIRTSKEIIRNLLNDYIKIYVTREYFHFLFHLSYRLLIPRELLYFQVSKFVF